MTSNKPEMQTEKTELEQGINPRTVQPMRIGQFRITTLLSWTTIVCFLMATLGTSALSEANSGNLLTWESFAKLGFLLIFFTPALFCIPILVDRLFQRDGLEFNFFWHAWLTLFLGVYSMLMLMLATLGFEADWKGSKGLHWSYYVLDLFAGMTLWPMYAIGVGLFIHSLSYPASAKRNPLLLLGVGTCAAISIWYMLATLFLNFTANEGPVFAIVPGATGIAYCLYAAIIWRNREFSWNEIKSKRFLILAWFSGLFVSVVTKYPLAVQIYNDLPDERPEGCFIVTAATRGHRDWVGTWYDDEQSRWLNQQLLTFWKLEDWLKVRVPRIHRLMRSFYNRVGPVIAKSIVFRWQADIVYMSLKPLELVSRWIVR